MKDTTTLHGKLPGPTSIIMAGNHGNEICGINAFRELLSTLTIDRGTVIFVLGNPRAIEKGVRFTEFNLNRAFGPASSYSEEIKETYEYARAQELKAIFDQGDALLDIHSTTNPGEPFIICEDNAIDIASRLPDTFKRIVYGFDALEPGGSDGYMLAKGKIGICIECGQHQSPDAGKNAKEAIYAFLTAREHLSSTDPLPAIVREMVHMDSIYHTETDSFVLDRPFFDFEKISAGTLIGTDGTIAKRASSDGVIVFAHNCSLKGAEAYLLGRTL